MLKAKGIYDGTQVILSEPLPIPSNSTVEILILEPSIDTEIAYWQQLLELGLIKSVCSQPTIERVFTPVQVTGAPVSETIVEERR